MFNQCSRFVLAALVLGFAVLAQGGDRPARSLGTVLGMPSRAGASIVVTSSGEVSLLGPGGLAKFTTGVTVVGAYEPIGTDATLTGLLVAGRDSVGGRVELWRPGMDPAIWALHSVHTSSTRDFCGVAVLGGTVYLLDCVGNEIVGASWDGVASLATWSLSVAVGSATVGELSSARRYYLQTMGVPGFPGASNGLFLIQIGQSPFAKRGVAVRLDANSGAFTGSNRAYWSRFGTPAGAVADESTAHAGGHDLVVYASSGLYFEIVDDTLTVIGAGTAPVGGGACTVTLSVPLEVGRTYCVRSGIAPSLACFKCIQRYGFPEVFMDGVAMERMVPSPTEYTNGNLSFSLSAPVTRAVSGGAAVSYIGGCLLALEGAPIAPFDNGMGVNSVLVSDFWVGSLGGLLENAMDGEVKMSFPLGSPSLEGVVLQAQFVVFDAVGFRLSEIVGFRVQSQ